MPTFSLPDSSAATRRLLRLAALALFCFTPALAANAQTITSPEAFNFTYQPKGVPTSATIVFSIPAPVTLGPPLVVTNGAPNLDFTLFGTTCAGAVPAGTCVVNVTFTPRGLGARNGAVLLQSDAGATLATAFVYGTGTETAGALGVMLSPTPVAFRNGFTFPYGLAVDGAGNLFVADHTGYAIEDLADLNGVASANSVHQSISGRFGRAPLSIATDAAGNVYVGGSGYVSKVQAVNGVVDGSSVATRLLTGANFFNIAIDGAGNIYAADQQYDQLFEIVANAGVPSSTVVTWIDKLGAPGGLAVDGAGNVLVAGLASGKIQEIVAVNGATSLTSPIRVLKSVSELRNELALDGDGDLYYSATDNGVRSFFRMDTVNGVLSPSSDVTKVGTNFVSPLGLAVDGAGNLYVSEEFSKTITLVPGGATPPSATITTPVAGSTLSSATTTFNWKLASNVSVTQILIGKTPGHHDYGGLQPNTGSSYTASGLPTDGSTVYVTLQSRVNGKWVTKMSTYTAYTAPGVASEIITPAPSTTLTGSSATFTWNAGTHVGNTQILIGKVPGHHEYGGLSPNTGSSYTVTGLPTDGRTIYVTLQSRIYNQWVTKAYTYTAYTAPGVASEITSPSPSSTLSGSSATFTWNAGSNVGNTQILIGKVPGHHEYGGLPPNTGSSYTATNLPTDGRTIYVMLQSRIHNQWVNRTYTYTSGKSKQ